MRMLTTFGFLSLHEGFMNDSSGKKVLSSKRAMIFATLVGIAMIASAHNSYTGGYSGAPGARTCASSCHGGTAGSLTVSGFPTSYIPGQTYRVTIAHTSGSPIVNFNATMRVGTTSSVAGAFAAVLNSTPYSGNDGGMYASPHGIDSAVFLWTAPTPGTGAVTLYAAAFQGTTSSSNGQSRAVAVTATEATTGIEINSPGPREIALSQNFPNPFNPSTSISFHLPSASFVTLRLFDALGRETATLVDEILTEGTHTARWNATNVPSGVYYYKIQSGSSVQTKKMVLLR